MQLTAVVDALLSWLFDYCTAATDAQDVSRTSEGSH